jgi:hypothetical protein
MALAYGLLPTPRNIPEERSLKSRDDRLNTQDDWKVNKPCLNMLDDCFVLPVDVSAWSTATSRASFSCGRGSTTLCLVGGLGVADEGNGIR